MRSKKARVSLAAALVLLLMGGVVAVTRSVTGVDKTHVVAFFPTSNGIYEGDDVVILGVAVGKIDKIEPQPSRVKVSFWFDRKYQVPADAKAVILSPSLVTARAIQLTPVYKGGPAMRDDAVIGENRTAVPVEFDDLRQQLQKLTEVLQPTQPGGVSTLGAFIDTTAHNLRGQGADIRQTVLKLSQAINALGDHSGDLFGTLKDLATLVSALQDSTGVMRDLNVNLAAVTHLLAKRPNDVANAVRDLGDVAHEVTDFVSDNRETLGTTSDKLASVSTAVAQSLDDIKQTLHIAPTAFQNFVNIYQPAQDAITGALAINNFSNPIQFLCGALQAASRLGAEQSAKLCVQYLAPIFKNRQYNFPPIGINPIVGAMARPDQVTYSEDWLRPDYIPPTDGVTPTPPTEPANAMYTYLGPAANPYDGRAPFVPARPDTPIVSDPAFGLPGMMMPPPGAVAPPASAVPQPGPGGGR